MATYTTNLVIELIGTGELAGTWGTTTNQNFQYVFEEAIVGRAGVAFSDANVTLTTTQATTDQTFRNVYLNCTGTNTAQRSLIVPTINKNYIVENNTTGGFAILVTTSGGTGLVVPNGYKAALYVDGTNVVTAFNYLASLTVAGSLTTGSYVANGSITSSAYIGAYSYGTLSYLDTNNFATFQTSANSYAQLILQNTNAGTAASADVIVSNNQGTASNYYGDFGINSSGFSGSGNFQAPNNVYLYSIGSDLAIGTQSSNAIHFIIGGAAASDALILDSNKNLGLGITPPSNSQSNGGLYIGSYASYAENTSTGATIVGQNVYYLSTAPVYRNTGYASLYQQSTSGVHSWLVAPSGAVNTASVTSGLVYVVASLGSTTLAQWQAYFSGLSTIPTVGQAITATATGSIAGGATVTAEVVFTTAMSVSNAGTLSTTYDALIHGLTVGQGAGAVSTNTAVGSSALGTVNTGAFNDSFGYNSLQANTSGTGNSAIGSGALYSNQSGSSNVAVGRQALQANTTASYNTAVGYQAGYYVTGARNTTIGTQTIFISSSSGNDNVAVGFQALSSNTTASWNVAVGSGISGVAASALGNNTTGQYNTAVGTSALQANTTASYNTAVGYQSAYANTTAQGTTAVGYQALQNNTTGTSNTAVGGGISGSIGSTLQSNTTGAYNSALGMGALASNTTANNNTAVGYQAGYSNTIATGNTAFGYQALYSANRTADIYQNNVAVGAQAGYSATTGQNNVFVGNGAGYYVTTGNKLTVLGNYNGNQGGLDIRTLSNYIVLSDGDGNPLIATANSQTVALKGAVPNSGTGITFPATQSASSDANTLDDYEKGTWTPLISDNGGGSDNWTSTTATGRYTKIGRLVSVQCTYTYTGKQSNGGDYAWMTGLPFNPSTSIGYFYVGINNGGGADTATYSGIIFTSGSIAFVKDQNQSGAGYMTGNDFPPATRTITFQANYIV